MAVASSTVARLTRAADPVADDVIVITFFSIAVIVPATDRIPLSYGEVGDTAAEGAPATGEFFACFIPVTYPATKPRPRANTAMNNAGAVTPADFSLFFIRRGRNHVNGLLAKYIRFHGRLPFAFSVDKT